MSVRVLGAERVQRLLRQAGERSKDLRPVFRGPIDAEVTRFFQRMFATEGAIGGVKWKPLSTATLAQKARINRLGMGILRRYNTLWASLTKSGHPQGVRRIERDGYERGTAVPYAVYHQLGLGVPERPLVPDPVPDWLSNKVADLIADFIVDGD